MEVWDKRHFLIVNTVQTTVFHKLNECVLKPIFCHASGKQMKSSQFNCTHQVGN